MKNAWIIFIFSCCCIHLSAQDTIIKRDGNQIISKIIEITAVQVKYKKFDFQDGPTYIENKSDIREIVYSNGKREEFKQEPVSNEPATNDYYDGAGSGREDNEGTDNKIEQYGIHYRYHNMIINDRKLNTILFQSKDKQIISLVGSSKDARRMEFIGFAAFPLGAASLVFFAESLIHPTYNVSYQKQPNTKYLTLSGICLAGTIACPIISGIYRHKSANYKRAAIKLYNERF